MVLELLSPTTKNEDRSTKFTIYEQTLRVPEYFLYDPDTHSLEGFRLIGQNYVGLQANEHGWLWSEELGLWLGNWVGVFQGENAETWLRLYTPDGQLVMLPEEAERQHAERGTPARAGTPAPSRNASAPSRNASAQRAEEELARLRRSATAASR